MDHFAQLLALRGRVADLAGLIDRVQSATAALFASDAPQEEWILLAQSAITESRAIRAEAGELVTAAGVPATWTDGAGLLAALEAAQQALQARRALLALGGVRRLADALEAGRVTHPIARTNKSWNDFRLKAVEQLRAVDAVAAVELPGPPEVEDWLSWFFEAGDEAAADTVGQLSADLATFLGLVTRERWQPGAAIPSIPVPPAAVRVEDVPPPAPVVEELPAPPVEAAENPPSLPPEPGAPAEVPAPPEDQAISEWWADEIVEDEAPPSEEPPGPVPSPHLPRSVTPRAEYAAPVLSMDDSSFEAFCKGHWIDPSGICELAPWRQPGFAGALTDAFFRALEGETFSRAMVFAVGAAESACEAVPTPDEVEAWAWLWQRPREAIGLGPDVVDHLREASKVGDLDDGRIWKFRLCLAALRPSSELPLSASEAKRWADAAGIASGPLREMVHLLLDLGRVTDAPIDEIRRVLKATGPRFEDLAQLLEVRRMEFHSEVRRMWSAAGGKVTRTHCRRAWDAFIAEIKETVETLYPASLGGKKDWDALEFDKRIKRFTKSHKEVADKWDAKFRDRHTMDRAAASIAARAAEINDLHRKARAARQEQQARPVSDDEMLRRTQTFLDDVAVGEAFEDCCRRMIRRHVEAKTGPEPRFGLTANDLLEYPALLGCVASGQDLSAEDGVEVIPITDVVAPSAAAAVLLRPAGQVAVLRPGETLLDRLSTLALSLNRYDLLAPLASRLPTSDQIRVRAARNDVLAEAKKVQGEVSRVREKLGDLTLALPADVEAALADAANRDKAVPTDEADRPSELQLFKGWLGRLAEYAGRLLRHEVEVLRRSVLNEVGADAAQVLRALDEGRYADAVYARSGPAGGENRPKVASRQTDWRGAARARFGKDYIEPLKGLHQSTKQLGAGDLEEMLGKWLAGVQGDLAGDQRLRTKFADVVFADAGGGELRAQGKSERSHFRIPCQKVRESLARRGLNPSFLPQLARAEELVIITPPAKVNDRGLVQQTANLIAGSHAAKIVAVLAPKISDEQRAALIIELRTRKLTAAVLDDLDLCRLLNVGGRQINLMIGLLELILEQLRWVDSSPFHAHDGAHARMEMYVGRRREAEVLATENTYSRLFSGRKFGKSALLKFIEEKYDGDLLPSGNTLRVLRIPIVGLESDAMVVHKVLAELRNRLGFAPSGSAHSTADAFLDALAEFLAARPNDSLLVILDEADVFVEKQLEEYDKHQERCLSFRIRSDAQKEVDRQGLPRIRFVFAGYRKTNTRGGAWGNWGDPLLLNPLEADEAAELIAGPLARLGIDAADVAPSIAFRCGYQPAVLLRFGERLLEYFDLRFPDVVRRESVAVTAAQVTEIYLHQSIQDEIRTVVRNNFQGNDAGQAVFSATLLAFANLAPGDALVDAPKAIWGRLRALVEGNPNDAQTVGAVRWLKPRHGSEEPTDFGRNEIKKHLEDFVERKLLVLLNRDDGVYRLRFPYHLSSLLVGVQDEAWAALLRLSRGESAGRDDHRGGDPLAPATLRDLEAVVRKYADLGLDYRAAILGTLWPASVARPDWLADRLGFDPGRLSRPGLKRDAQAVAFLEVGAAEVEELLCQRQPLAPPAFLLGGVDLLRWGLHAAHRGEAIEVHGQGRLSRPAVDRWLLRTRGFGFEGDELNQTYQLTGGIALLLGVFDECLREAMGADEGGVHVGPAEFERAAADYKKRLPKFVARLRPDSTGTARLEPREAELLMMVVAASRATEWMNPVRLTDLGDDWQLYEDEWKQSYPHLACPSAWSDGAEDRLALRLITELGLLPCALDPPADALPRADPLAEVIVPMLARIGG